MAAKTPEAISREAVVGANVRRLREAAGLSQAELASQVVKSGHTLGEMAVWGIENGKRRINVDDLFALGTALGVTPTSLLSPDAGPGILFVVSFASGGSVDVTADEYDIVSEWVRFHMQGQLVYLASTRHVLGIRVQQDGDES
ncbi:helix-turn-helix domain-containing protein [Streptomyces ipomoeae]|uniref:helix-turn-helix domain-containing protein n=1 Tax=Streptomyces ipomoeae TaxID=103232 RepID=UPI0029B11849|nr:helix-turn-helix transcriptional regulator [Streptomyces ipomoeae]MDX2697110.1 helix-turn-helix transcriptional regulator [Streptomyces ipomoeae]